MRWGEVRMDFSEYGTPTPAPYRPQLRENSLPRGVKCVQGSMVSTGTWPMGSTCGLFGYPHYHHKVNQKINESHPTAGNAKSAPPHLCHPHPAVTVPYHCAYFLGTASQPTWKAYWARLSGVCQGPSFPVSSRLFPGRNYHMNVVPSQPGVGGALGEDRLPGSRFQCWLRTIQRKLHRSFPGGWFLTSRNRSGSVLVLGRSGGRS